MRNGRLAESILSLVTTPERASATVGDLLEDRLHGLVTREVDGKRGYFVDCVRQD